MKKSILKLLPLFIFFHLFAGFFHPIRAMDQDLGRHLLVGDIVLKTLNVPKTNLFSYTYPDFPFINHHWGSEVLYFLIFKLGDFTALQIFGAALFVGAFAFVFFYSLKKGNILASAFVSILFIPILLERTEIRPELFSFLFLSLFLVILYKFRNKFTKWIFLLPILQFFWVNMHVYAIIGIFVIGLFLLDTVLTRIITRKKIFDARFKTLISVLLVCCFTSLINPNGLSGALYPLKVFQNYGYTIQENQSVSKLSELGFPQPVLPHLLTSIILLFTCLFVSFRKTKPVDWLLSISFSLIAFSAVRNFPLFVFATFIPFSKSLADSLSGISLEDKPLARGFGKILPFVLISFLIWQTTNIVSQKGFGIGTEISAEKAADFYIANNLKGPIFNNFDIGSYLDYRLYPKERVFIDGRPEAYPASFIQKTYIPMQENPKVFAKTQAKYKFNTIFFSHTDQTPWAKTFLPAILENKNWKTVYLDDTVIILAKDSEKNKNLIDKFGMDKESLKAKNVNKNNFQSLLKLAHFYHNAGLKKQEVEVFKMILDLKPNFCPALQNLAVILSEEQNPQAQTYITRFQQSCQN